MPLEHPAVPTHLPTSFYQLHNVIGEFVKNLASPQGDYQGCRIWILMGLNRVVEGHIIY